MAKSENDKEIIKLRALKKRFGVGDAENYALNGVDLKVKQGEFIIIMGPSGCGKTTLLNILGLLDRATSGDYILNNRNVVKLTRRRHAQIRSQKSALFFRISILSPA